MNERDLIAAIDECLCEPFTFAKCQKLAVFVTVYEHFFRNREKHAEMPLKVNADFVEYNSSSEFSQAINGKKQASVFPVLEELMDAMQILQPKIYDQVLQKLYKA